MKTIFFVWIFVLIGIFALNGCEDSKNYTYQPKDRTELVNLINDENVNLSEIDTSKVRDFSFLFAHLGEECDDTLGWHKEDLLTPYLEKCKNTGIKRLDKIHAIKKQISDITLQIYNIESALKKEEQCKNDFEAFIAPRIQWRIQSKEGFFDEHSREYVKRKTLNDKERAQVRNEVIKENKSCIFLENADDGERIPSLEVQKVDLEGQLSHLLERLGTIVHWNTKNVKDMSFTFAKGFAWELLGNDYGQEAETKAELHWDTSNVENMQGMFFENYALSEEIQEWVTHLNVSQVTDMSYMFFMSNFNKDINAWNVGRVENMEAMFAHNFRFNQPLDKWNTSRVKNMAEMFYCALSFNQNIQSWNVGNVENMRHLFGGLCAVDSTSGFNQPLNAWNVSRVRDMSGMFAWLYDFNQPLDKWDTSSVENMSGMFKEAISFNQPLNSWNVSQVKDMSYMFSYAQSFNQPLDSWDTSNVEDMGAMFADSAFNQPINNWNVQKVEDMSKMFHSRVFNQPLDKWQVKSLKNMQGMFSESFLQNIDSWEIDRTQVKTADAFSPESPFLPKWYGEDTINDEELIAEVSSCFKFGLGCEADKVRFELPFKENNIKFFKGDKQGGFTHICLPYAEYSDEKRTKDIYKSISVCLDSIKVPQAKTMTLHFKDMRYQTHIGECEGEDS
ncbi:BspA family leucine-rich repeat surface protein [Helicobacter japonicus]|uniref:BspA family leucine-rich repeat surface protein n=2 Tax=Helicobacter japonicus TaxID=425400 RepID=A0A4U8TTD6_9HELI|nr:BspA family leucine-rich repeat surface protein [Helicobacter japonicus]TLE03339.1 BspA family leucine-rich repeat surface protein [Helicobacter japonicus]